MARKPTKDQIWSFIKKWWLSLLLIYFSWLILKQFWWALEYNIFFAVNYNHPFPFSWVYFIMDNLTLIIHEAGHTLFGIFGWRFLTILGGTLLQILIPILILGYTYRAKKSKTMQLSLYWLGFSFLDTAAYCADANLMQLPLLGNLSKSAHDFSNMLISLDLLPLHNEIAWGLYSMGVVFLLGAVLVPLAKLGYIEEVQSIDLDLNL